MILKGAEWLPSDVVRLIIGWKDARSAIFDTTGQAASHVTQFQPCVRLVLPEVEDSTPAVRDWAPLCRLPVASFVVHAGRGSLGYRSFPTGRGFEVLGRTAAEMLKPLDGLPRSRYIVPNSHILMIKPTQFSSVYISNHFLTQIFSPIKILFYMRCISLASTSSQSFPSLLPSMETTAVEAQQPVQQGQYLQQPPPLAPAQSTLFP
jgi:hypothetical protein